jgi:hypothetical protein
MNFLRRLFGRQSAPVEQKPPAEAFLGLRTLALDARNDPNLSGSPADEPVAVLMESGHDSGVTVTLACLADGTTSLYFGHGGGILGSGNHAPVAESNKAWLTQAKEFAAMMSPTTEFPLPATGRVRFYLLFPGRALTAEAGESELGWKRHALSPLFHGGQAVTTQIRLHSPR